MNHSTRTLLLAGAATFFSPIASAVESPASWLEGALTGELCQYAGFLLEDLPHAPLYAQSPAGGCSEADLNNANGTLYSDATCTDPVQFKPTKTAEWCDASLNPEKLGDASDAPSDTVWTLNPGTRIDIGLNSIKNNHQPFMSRTEYRQVPGNGGTCQLEMRVFKKDLAATDVRPMLMIHGGSWQYRGAGYIGQEALVSHYTDAGFVVFAPFYRLASDTEAGPYCNGVTQQAIIEDIDAALTWTQEQATRYGASDDKITVTGQSAGGYLAASLATRFPNAIDRALLFYPPTDFIDFLSSIENGSLLDAEGKSALEAFVGRSVEEMNADDADIVALSLPQQIENQGGDLPPMFIVHGAEDTLVPAKQSSRLCNALGGSADSGVASPFGGDTSAGEFRKIYSCDDNGSELHITAEGQHVLDVCKDFPDLANALGIDDICFSGDNPTGRAQSLASLQSAISWLNAASPAPEEPTAPDVTEDQTTPPNTTPTEPAAPDATEDQTNPDSNPTDDSTAPASVGGGSGGGATGLPGILSLLLFGAAFRRKSTP